MVAMQPASGRALVARRWVGHNLFSNRWNGVLTVGTVAVLGLSAFAGFRFIFVNANWETVEVNRRLLFLATFPADEEWRLWPPIWLFAAVAGLAYGLWSRVSARDLAIAAGAAAFVFVLLAEGDAAARLALASALAIGGYVLGQTARESRYDAAARRVTIAGGVAVLPLMLLLLNVGGGVRTTEWGGVMLNIMLAAVGIGAGFPFAWCSRSVVRAACRWCASRAPATSSSYAPAR